MKTLSFLVIESHLKSRHYDHEIHIEDYSSLRADRPVINKEGVIIYTHNDFTVDDKDIYADTICQAAMIYNSTNNLILVAIYRPPRADDKSFTNCLNKISAFIDKHDDADILVMGDLNTGYINWETKMINRSNRLTSEVVSAQSLLTLLDKHFLKQMVTEPTREDRSILDLVITNNTYAVHTIQVEKIQWTDHDMVWTQLSYKDLNTSPTHSNHEPDSPLDKLNLTKANWPEIRKYLATIDWEEDLKNKDVDEILQYLNEKLISTCKDHTPDRVSKTSNKPFIPRHRRSLLKIRKRINQKINL